MSSCINRDYCNKQQNNYVKIQNDASVLIMVPSEEKSTEPYARKEGFFFNNPKKTTMKSSRGSVAAYGNYDGQTVSLSGIGMEAETVGGPNQYSTFDCYGSWEACSLPKM